MMNITIQTGDIVDRLGFEDGYRTIRDTGFTAIDWNLDHAVKHSDLSSGAYLGKSIMEKPLGDVIDYYADELAVIRKNGLVITQAHAPFPAYIPGKPEVLDYMIGIYKRNIEYCDYCGCKNLVIHGITLGFGNQDDSPEYIDGLNWKLYSSLIPVLRETNVTVCLEDLFTTEGRIRYMGHCGNPVDAAALIDRLNAEAGRECFGFCFDVGHSNLLRWDFRYYVGILGKRIKCLHIHDNDGIADTHMAPLTGTVRWKQFVAALRDIGYDGDFDFETFNQTNVVMDFDRELLVPWMNVIYAFGKSVVRQLTE